MYLKIFLFCYLDFLKISYQKLLFFKQTPVFETPVWTQINTNDKISYSVSGYTIPPYHCCFSCGCCKICLSRRPTSCNSLWACYSIFANPAVFSDAQQAHGVCFQIGAVYFTAIYFCSDGSPFTMIRDDISHSISAKSKNMPFYFKNYILRTEQLSTSPD